MKKCKEIIVVEGKNDIAAIKKALEAEVIAVGGFSVSKPSTLQRLKQASKKQGIIIFTDPDPAGERIRSVISRYVPEAKHAFIRRSKALRAKDGKIGVEHASPLEILKSLEEAKFQTLDISEVFTLSDLFFFGLTGQPDSKKWRLLLGEELGIGYGNAKQFLRRLNHFQISRNDFLEALEKIFSHNNFNDFK